MKQVTYTFKLKDVKTDNIHKTQATYDKITKWLLENLDRMTSFINMSYGMETKDGDFNIIVRKDDYGVSPLQSDLFDDLLHMFEATTRISLSKEDNYNLLITAKTTVDHTTIVSPLK